MTDDKKKNETPHARKSEQEPTDKSGSDKFSYPASDDIYSRDKQLPDVDPENPAQLKSPNPKVNTRNEKNFADDVTGGDLDVPGAELDDDMEDIGSEDEENNLYSLGDNNTKV